MIEALFFIAGLATGIGASLFVVVLALARFVLAERKKEIVLPQGLKRDSIDAQIRQVWSQPQKQEGAVVMPERADITNKDLKIDDLLQ